MKKLFPILIVIFLLIIWGKAFGQDVVRFGCAVSLTGKLNHEGQLTKDGYEFYKALINKKGGLNIGGKKYKIDIKYYDDESNVQTGTKLIEKLITEDKIDFLIGPYGSGPSFATSAITEKYKKVMMLTMASSLEIFSRGFKYMFSVLATTDMYYKDILSFVAQQSPKPKVVAVLWKNDLANKSMSDPIPQYCKDNGLDLVYNEKFAAGASDFSAELTVIKAKNPDIFLFLSQLEQFVMAVKQSKDMRFNAKMISSGIAVPQPDLIKTLGKDAEYLVGPVQWYRTFKYKDDLFGDSPNYVKEFKQIYGYEPEYHNVGSSAGVQILGIAIEKAGTLDVEKVRNTLATTNLNTFWGPIQYDERGLLKGRQMPVGQIINGKFTAIYPPELAETKFVWPKPTW